MIPERLESGRNIKLSLVKLLFLSCTASRSEPIRHWNLACKKRVSVKLFINHFKCQNTSVRVEFSIRFHNRRNWSFQLEGEVMSKQICT
jgi:hypothetical protein